MPEPTRARGVGSPDRADALIGAIILGRESQINWKEAIVFRRQIKHRMQFRIPPYRPRPTPSRLALMTASETPNTTMLSPGNLQTCVRPAIFGRTALNLISHFCAGPRSKNREGNPSHK